MVSFIVNGKEVSVSEERGLMEVLRGDLGFKSVKDGCSEGACGTCTVIIDGKATKACVQKAERLAGKTIVTVEGLSERFEAICNGKELCNAYSELNDPIDQRERFAMQLELGKRGDEESMVLDEDFLRALEFGMPPTAGLGIGIDRLSMIMTDSHSVQDVLFFPQMKSV